MVIGMESPKGVIRLNKLAADNLDLYRLRFLTMLGRGYSMACNL